MRRAVCRVSSFFSAMRDPSRLLPVAYSLPQPRDITSLNIALLFMLSQLFRLPLLRSLLAVLFALAIAIAPALPARADSIDPYVKRYLKANEPVSIPLNEQGETTEFTPEALSNGKQLFGDNCLSCHVGGSTLPNPAISLSKEALAGATPPRDNLENLIDYFRQPMTYDGTAELYGCRQITERWMSQPQVEDLGAFILRAAEKAPGWGTQTF